MAENRVVIVTGAGSGIGLAAVQRLLDEDWIVVGADHDPARLGAAGDAVPGAHWLRMDVTDEASVAAAVDAAARLGSIRGLVNSAGIAESVPFADTPLALFERTLAVNLTGTFLAGRAAAAVMREVGGGAIVNIASVSGLRGSPGRTAYAASKGGVIALTNVMAIELAEQGIRVNAIAPGPVETPLVKAVHGPEVRQALLRAVPLHRYARPGEIADVIAYLLDGRRASYVNGQTLGVDGGLMAGAGWSLPPRG